jgi:hypothetical protein
MSAGSIDHVRAERVEADALPSVDHRKLASHCENCTLGRRVYRQYS